MSLPKIGNLAPNFKLTNQDGEPVSLKEFRGTWNLVLYFYPRASTPGCTVQACGMRDLHEELAKLDTLVLGISPDAPAKLKKFIDKYDLNFPLLADEDHSVAEQYGVWALKKFMGKEFMGIVRTSFIINKEGRLVHIMDKVNTKTHDQDILDILQKGL